MSLDHIFKGLATLTEVTMRGVLVLFGLIFLVVNANAFARHHHLRSIGDGELDEKLDSKTDDGVSKSGADDAAGVKEEAVDSGDDESSAVEGETSADDAAEPVAEQEGGLKECTSDNYKRFAIASFMATSTVCNGSDESKKEACIDAQVHLQSTCLHMEATCMAFWSDWCPAHSQEAEKKPEVTAQDTDRCSKAILVQFLMASSTSPCSLQSTGDRADKMVEGIVESRNCPGKEGVVREAIREAYTKGCKTKEMLENTRGDGVDEALDCSNVDNLTRHFMNIQPSTLCANTIEKLCQDPILSNCDSAICLEKAETIMRTRQCNKCDSGKAEEHLRALSDVCNKEASVFCTVNLSLKEFECEPEACAKLLGKVQRELDCSSSCNADKMRKDYENMDSSICEQTAEEHCTEDKLSDHNNCDQAKCIEVVSEVLAAKDCGGLCDYVALSAWWEEKEGVCKKSEEEHCKDNAADMERMRCTHVDCVTTVKTVMKEKLCPSSDDELLASTAGKKEVSPEQKQKESEAIKAQEKLPVMNTPAECDSEGMREASITKKSLCEAGMSEFLSNLALEYNCSEEETMLVINKLRKSECVGGRLISENTCDINGLIKSLKTKNALCEDDAPKLICGRVMSRFPSCSLIDCVGAISAERANSCKQSGVEVHVLADTTQVNDVDELIRGKDCNDQGLFDAMAGMESKCEPEMATYCGQDDANLMGCSVKVCKQLLTNIQSVECPELVKAGDKPSSGKKGGELAVEEKMVVYDGDKPKAISGDEAAASEKPGHDSAKKPAVAPADAENNTAKDEKLTPADNNAQPEKADESLKSLSLACATMGVNDYNEHATVLCGAHEKNKSEVGPEAYSKTCAVICANPEKTGQCVDALENVYANCEDFQ